MPKNVDFLVAEGTGLEPVDQYYRSRISNPLHYRSANPPIMDMLFYTLIIFFFQ